MQKIKFTSKYDFYKLFLDAVKDISNLIKVESVYIHSGQITISIHKKNAVRFETTQICNYKFNQLDDFNQTNYYHGKPTSEIIDEIERCLPILKQIMEEKFIEFYTEYMSNIDVNCWITAGDAMDKIIKDQKELCDKLNTEKPEFLYGTNCCVKYGTFYYKNSKAFTFDFPLSPQSNFTHLYNHVVKRYLMSFDEFCDKIKKYIVSVNLNSLYRDYVVMDGEYKDLKKNINDSFEGINTNELNFESDVYWPCKYFNYLTTKVV